MLVDRGEPRNFSTLLDYIHLNPVRAGISDFSDYVGVCHIPGIWPSRGHGCSKGKGR